MPVVVVTGARQTGKTTLAQRLAPGTNGGSPPSTISMRSMPPNTIPIDCSAVAMPSRWTRFSVPPAFSLPSNATSTTDECPGVFLLTGSANLALMASVSESLAGRASYLTLWPMARQEQRGLGRTGCWDDLLVRPGFGLAEHPDRAAATRGGLAGSRATRRIPRPLGPPGERWRTGDLVRRLYPDVPRARPRDPIVRRVVGRLSSTGPYCLSPRRPSRQPNGDGKRCRHPSTDGAPLPEPARSVLSPRTAARLRRQPDEAAHQVAEALLV